jgi:hypothetical protein
MKETGRGYLEWTLSSDRQWREQGGKQEGKTGRSPIEAVDKHVHITSILSSSQVLHRLARVWLASVSSLFRFLSLF